MVTGDVMQVDIHALVDHMEDDTRQSVDDRAFLVLYHAKLNATTTTTREEDMRFVQCVKRVFCQDENYVL